MMLVSAFGLLGRGDLKLALVGAAGLGRAAEARPPGHRPARVRRRRGARAALPRRHGIRLSVAVRGLRDPDRRGDGERRPVVASSHESMDEAAATRRCEPIPRRPEAFAGAISAALDDRGARGRARPRARVRASLACDRPAFLRGYAAAPRDEGRAGRLSARPDRRGTARYLPRLAGVRGVELVRLATTVGSGPPRSTVTPSGTRSSLPRQARGGASRRPALPDLPRSVRPAFVPARRYRSRSCRSAPPGDLQPVDAAIQPGLCVLGWRRRQGS